jgi:hypothetical protein
MTVLIYIACVAIIYFVGVFLGLDDKLYEFIHKPKSVKPEKVNHINNEVEELPSIPTTVIDMDEEEEIDSNYSEVIQDFTIFEELKEPENITLNTFEENMETINEEPSKDDLLELLSSENREDDSFKNLDDIPN